VDTYNLEGGVGAIGSAGSGSSGLKSMGSSFSVSFNSKFSSNSGRFSDFC